MKYRRGTHLHQLRSRKGPPQFLMPIWNEARIRYDLQPNGYIKNVMWSDRLVTVRYYDSEGEDREEEMDWDALDGNWADLAFREAMKGGGYVLYDPSYPWPWWPRLPRGTDDT